MTQLRQFFTRERQIELALFLVLLLCYGYFFPRWADPNQNSRLDMVVAVVDDGTFQIDRYVANTVDYAKVGEHYYSDKAPGVAFLGIPVYAVLGKVLDLPFMAPLTERLANSSAFQSTLNPEGTGVNTDKVRFAIAQVALSFLFGAVPTAILGVLLFRVLGRFSDHLGLRLVLALAYGLLTPAFAYANTFYGHQLSAFLLFGAFYWVFMAAQPLNPARLMGVGALLAYSVVTEYPTFLLVGVLFLYTLYVLVQQGEWRRVGWVIGPAGVIAAAWMLYNKTIFGGYLELGYGYSELWVDQHSSGFMSLGLPHPEAVWGITFGLFRGLFWLSPWLLLALPGVVQWWHSRQYRVEWLVTTACIGFMFLFNSSSVMWWGGFSVGPRYLLPMLPFLVVPVAMVLRPLTQPASPATRWLIRGFALLLVWSFLATWGMTLAGQSFPPDTIPNPWLDYLLPHWQEGNIARNLGTIIGFKGLFSLVPVLLLLLALLAWPFFTQFNRQSAPLTHHAPRTTL